MSNAQSPARREQPPASQKEKPQPKRELTKHEVQEQLRRRSESMDGHLEGMQQEAGQLQQDLVAKGKEVQQKATEAVQQNVLAAIGGAGVAGVAIGYWLVRRRQKKQAALAARTWADEYRDAVRREVRGAAERGEDPGEAAGRILEGHRPLVVREQASSGGTGGFFSTVLGLAGRTLVTLAVRYAVDTVADQYLPSREADDLEDAGDAAAVTSAAAE